MRAITCVRIAAATMALPAFALAVGALFTNAYPGGARTIASAILAAIGFLLGVGTKEVVRDVQ